MIDYTKSILKSENIINGCVKCVSDVIIDRCAFRGILKVCKSVVKCS